MGVWRSLLDVLIEIDALIVDQEGAYINKRNQYIDQCYRTSGAHALTKDEIEDLKIIDIEFAESIELAFAGLGGALQAAVNKNSRLVDRVLSSFDNDSGAVKPSDWSYLFPESGSVIDTLLDAIDYNIAFPRFSLVDAWHPGVEHVMNYIIDMLKS